VAAPDKVTVIVSGAPPVVIGAKLIAEKRHSFNPPATTGRAVCRVQAFPSVSEMPDCVEQAVEPELNACTETTSTLPTVVALVVVTEADEHVVQ
jgi:hypothetical protein